MKIGILTYHNTNNFGGALQAYALQKYIEKLNIDCEIIDYRSETILERYNVKNIDEIKGIKEFIKYVINHKSEKDTKTKFDEFYLKYMKITSVSYDKETIGETNDIFDKFIVGSDQVWNLSLSGNDLTYYLDFVRNNYKKNSYAASFGTPYLKSESITEINEMLNAFNNLSLREPKPNNLILENMDKVNVNLDPTFLIQKEEWDTLCKPLEIKLNKKYILLYTVAVNDEIFSFVKKLAKRDNCEIIYLHHTHRIRLGTRNIRNIGPNEFLTLIKNAHCVVTTSFHGIALAINFEKEFYFGLSKSGENYNSRILNITKIFGLEGREISNKSLVEPDPINYKVVNNVLQKERKKAFNFINKIIEN